MGHQQGVAANCKVSELFESEQAAEPNGPSELQRIARGLLHPCYTVLRVFGGRKGRKSVARGAEGRREEACGCSR
jgi:hypothetical protein